MGFNSVYKCLQEIFPQVDARILRAVAIEHPKDVDFAAGIVLNEVIPLLSKRAMPLATPPHDVGPGAVTNVEVEEGNKLRHEQFVENALKELYVPCSAPVENIQYAHYSIGPEQSVILGGAEVPNSCTSNDSTDKFLRVNEGVEQYSSGKVGPEQSVILEGAEVPNSWTSNDSTDKILRINESVEQYSSGKVGENLSVDVTNKITDNATSGLKHGAGESCDYELELVNIENKDLFSSGLCHEMQSASTNNSGNGNEGNDFNGPTADNSDAITCAISHRLEGLEPSFTEGESSDVEAVYQGQRHMPNAKECSLQLEIDCGPSITAERNMQIACSFSEQRHSVSKASDEDEICGEDVVSQSNQVCGIDLLEQIIDEAKTNKKTLFSSMESLICLMREVELQEKAAEQTKMEAALGGSEILINVEELKKMLMHAKEANDMHAGEVYGEKAILATEMKELQSRLLSLSDEKNKSLVILDEMSLSLRVRLAAAEELRKAAEQEKLEKEESARKALAEQEAIMEKVVRESTRLQQEAEENSRLREFLIDRGWVVDALQGEISVICQDIRILKTKFDANLPLSKSFTSSQTSCILASSGSSHKSSATDPGSYHGDLLEILGTKPASSTGELLSENGNEEESRKTEHKAPVDDEWDFILEEDKELHS